MDSTKSNGLNEFYDDLRDIQFKKGFKEKGSPQEVLRVFCLKSELKPVAIKEIHFRHVNATLSEHDVSAESLKARDVECSLMLGVPALEVLFQLLQQSGYHLESFHDGVLVINTWGRPQYAEDDEPPTNK